MIGVADLLCMGLILRFSSIPSPRPDSSPLRMHATSKNDIRRERSKAPGRSSAADRIHGRWQAPPAGQRRGVTSWDGLSLACLLFQHPTDVDEVVGDDAEPDPALHSDSAFVAAAVEPVSPFDHADAPLASVHLWPLPRDPRLSAALALRLLRAAIRRCDAFDASALSPAASFLAE